MDEIKSLSLENKKLLADLAMERENLKDKTKELENLREKLKFTEENLIQSEKIISLGMLASGVAHELNGPLIAILGLTDLIMLEKLSCVDMTKDLREIKASAMICKRIINDWLGFVRHQEFSIKMADICEVIEKTLALAAYRINTDKIQIIKDYAKSLPQIEMSISHIQQVFLNIILNAADAMPQGGTLTITAFDAIWNESLTKKNNGIIKKSPATLKAGSKVILVEFKDTGKGIQKEVLQKIFDPFFTTKDIGRGTGLGLSVSLDIISKHKGTIEAYSGGQGLGSTFTVILPIKQMEL